MSESSQHQKSVELCHDDSLTNSVNLARKAGLIDYFYTISKLNQDFYQEQADSFSKTRASAWEGWEKVYPYITELARKKLSKQTKLQSEATENTPLLIFDLACGNLRFERYLAERQRSDFDASECNQTQPYPDHEQLAQKNPKLPLLVQALDSCQELLELGELSFKQFVSTEASTPDIKVELIQHDLMSSLIEAYKNTLENEPFSENLNSSDAKRCWPPLPEFDHGQPVFVACFGFMHHIPSYRLRYFALENLCKSLTSGSVIAVSFWEYLSDETRVAKAEVAHQAAVSKEVIADRFLSYLEPGDRFLGWNKQGKAARFCHSFSPEELDELCGALETSAQLLSRFRADGKNHKLNEYLILQVL